MSLNVPRFGKYFNTDLNYLTLNGTFGVITKFGSVAIIIYRFVWDNYMQQTGRRYAVLD